MRATTLATTLATTTAAILLGLLTPHCVFGDEALPLGISKTKPDSGRYVETERGFMVPYTVKIPGTDITYSMEPIPGGTFTLGSSPDEEGHQPEEGPQVEVSLPPYWLGKHEVRWAEYHEFMNLYAAFKEFESREVRVVTDDNKIDAITAPTELYDPSFTYEYGEDDDQPAVTMTQYAAKQYTKWLTGVTGHQYRLPSEAEWEYACRAGTTTRYHFGDDPAKLGEFAWYYENSEEMPQHVGTKQPNPWGLYDMHGNVWEWVLDAFLDDGYARLKDKRAKGADAIAWPDKLYPRVVRGGSWDDDPERLRSAAKMGSDDTDWKGEDPNLPLSPWWFTSDPSRGVGFRLCRPLDELPKDAMARYWDPDVEESQFDVKSRIDEGRGVYGLVDKELPAALESLK